MSTHTHVTHTRAHNIHVHTTQDSTHKHTCTHVTKHVYMCTYPQHTRTHNTYVPTICTYPQCTRTHSTHAPTCIYTYTCTRTHTCTHNTHVHTTHVPPTPPRHSQRSLSVVSKTFQKFFQIRDFLFFLVKREGPTWTWIDTPPRLASPVPRSGDRRRP